MKKSLFLSFGLLLSAAQAGGYRPAMAPAPAPMVAPATVPTAPLQVTPVQAIPARPLSAQASATQVSAAQAPAVQNTAQAQTLKLRILETSDLHTNALGYDYYQDKPTAEFGLDYTAGLIRAARAEQPNTLLFDNGDLIQGTPLGDYVARIKPLAQGEQHPMHRAMSTLNYDAGTLGNHEFNYGLNFLDQVLAQAPFAYVNANVENLDGTPRFTEMRA